MKKSGWPLYVHFIGAGLVLAYAIWSYSTRNMALLPMISYIVGPAWMLWGVIRAARSQPA